MFQNPWIILLAFFLVLGPGVAFADDDDSAPSVPGSSQYDDGVKAAAVSNYKKAMKFFVAADELGYQDAARCIGVLYESGQGVTQDYQQALEWYRTGCSNGDAEAFACVGLMYELGEGMPKDYKAALEQYEKAAAKGDSDSENFIGLLYEYGHGVPRDNQQALAWYQKSAAQGNAGAQASLKKLQRKMAAQP